MDLTNFDVSSAADQGADLHLKHPSTGEALGTDKKPVYITLLGRDSKKLKDAVKSIEKRRLKGEDIDKEAEGLELLCASVIGWEGIEFDGKPLEFKPANVRKLFSDPRTEWVGEQTMGFSLSRRNYVKNMHGG